MYEIQQREVVEEANTKERQEIAEIEAMFEALAVAERAESDVTSGTATASSTPSPSRQKAHADKTQERAAQNQNQSNTNEQKRNRQRGVNTWNGGWETWAGTSWSGRSWDWSEGRAWRAAARCGWRSDGWAESDEPGETTRWVPKTNEHQPAEAAP
jgi:hypothetical protein